MWLNETLTFIAFKKPNRSAKVRSSEERSKECSEEENKDEASTPKQAQSVVRQHNTVENNRGTKRANTESEG